MSDGIRDAEGKRAGWMLPEHLAKPAHEHVSEDIALQRAVAYVDLCHTLLARYAELFPTYAWTDPQSAVDLMVAEIRTLQKERDEAGADLRAAQGRIERLRGALEPFAKYAQARLSVLGGKSRSAYMTSSVDHVSDADGRIFAELRAKHWDDAIAALSTPTPGEFQRGMNRALEIFTSICDAEINDPLRFGRAYRIDEAANIRGAAEAAIRAELAAGKTEVER